VLIAGLFSIVSTAGMIYFFNAFKIIGERNKNNLLRVTSKIFIVVLIIGIVFNVLFTSYALFNVDAVKPYLQPDTDVIPFEIAGIFGAILGFLIGFLIIMFLFVIGITLLIIFFAVGLLRLKNVFPIAKTAAVLDFVTLGLAITILLIPVALITGFVSFIVKLVLLKQASEKYETGKIGKRGRR
jgi:hypothetical protein